jgi:hypothetical protein
MGLESGNYIGNLVPANPLGTDAVSDGDAHIRLIKDVLQKTFGAWTKAFVPAPTGAIMWFSAGVTLPSGYLLLDGSLHSKTTYSELWAWIQSYGVIKSQAEYTAGWQGAFVDYDASQFRLPNFLNRTNLGAGSLLPGQSGTFEAQIGSGAIIYYNILAPVIVTGSKSL